MVPTAVSELKGSSVKVASVATAFPSGRSSLKVKLADTKIAVDAGADEIDMVVDRGAFLAGHYGTVFEQIVAVKQTCGEARLKVILETGELATYDNVRRACWLALLAGADFIKTSTGKMSPAATLPVVHVMLQAVKDWKAAAPTRSPATSRRKSGASRWSSFCSSRDLSGGSPRFEIRQPRQRLLPRLPAHFR